MSLASCKGPPDATAGPFEVTAGGRAWTLPATVDSSDLIAVAHETVGPAPALSAVGTVDDRTVFVGLESAPCTVINGDPDDARRLLWALVIDLATSDRADDIDLMVIGEPPEGIAALKRVRYASEAEDILDELERHTRSVGATVTFTGERTAYGCRLAGHGDGLAPIVLVAANDPGVEAAERLHRQRPWRDDRRLWATWPSMPEAACRSPHPAQARW